MTDDRYHELNDTLPNIEEILEYLERVHKEESRCNTLFFSFERRENAEYITNLLENWRVKK
jgi:hypothetical protein